MMIKRNFIAILTALAATTLFATACGGDVECGKDTVEKDGKCVAKDGSGAGTTCGDGTVLEDGICVPDGSGCGAGTVLEDGVCVADGEGGATCGEGTTLDSATGKCVANANIECGDGTVAQGDKCVPSADTCTAGTKLEDGKCVVDPTTCGEGTELDANTGICTLVEEACGEGLALTDGKCVPTAEVCDEGTTFSEDTGLCLPDATCKVGDVIVDGICLSPAAALFADPSAVSIDGAGVEIELPAEGERAIFTGTINAPVEEADGSLTNNVDTFTFQGEAGQYVKLTLQALNSVDLVFEVEGPEGVNATEYVRTSSVGVEVVPARYVYIPYDGEYTVSVQPSMGWLFDLNADGGEGFEYAGTLEQLETPTATELTVDKETPVVLSGNSRNLTSNLYKFDGSADGDLVTFTLDDFGVDAGSSIFVLSNDTPPAVIAEHTDLGSGASIRVPGNANGFQILVDNNLVIGPKTQFEMSGIINGVIDTVIVDAEDSAAVTGTVAPNTILKVSFDSDAGNKLKVSVLNANDEQLGQSTTVEAGEVFHMFHSAGGDFTINLENGGGQAISAVTTVEFITPTDLGALGADSTLAIGGGALNVGQEQFFLIDVPTPSQVLRFAYNSPNAPYYYYEDLLADLLSGEIWNEDGSKLDTSSFNIFEPGFPVLGQSFGGQYMAIRVAQVPANELCINDNGTIICNEPYDRLSYDLTVTGITPEFLPGVDPGYMADDLIDVLAEDGLAEGESDFYHLTVEETVFFNAYIEALLDGDVDMILYDNNLKQLAFADEEFTDVILTAGVYFLEVNAYEAAPEGYEIFGYFDDASHLQISSGTNHSFATADEITDLARVVFGNSTESVNGPYEYFKVVAPENGTLRITGEILTGPDETEMQVNIYEEDTITKAGFFWTAIYPGYYTDSVNISVEQGKTYYIVVGGNYTAYSGKYTYTLQFELLPPPPPAQVESGNNNTFATADEVLAIPVTLKGSSSDQNGASDHSYWKFTATTDATLKLTAVHKGGAGWMYYTIYEDDFTTVALPRSSYISAGVGSATRNFEVLAGETYYIFIGGGFSTGDPYNYELIIEEL